jgi:hypothetical protein
MMPQTAPARALLHFVEIRRYAPSTRGGELNRDAATAIVLKSDDCDGTFVRSRILTLPQRPQERMS